MSLIDIDLIIDERKIARMERDAMAQTLMAVIERCEQAESELARLRAELAAAQHRIAQCASMARERFVCACAPEWTGRDMHAPDCLYAAFTDFAVDLDQIFREDIQAARDDRQQAAEAGAREMQQVILNIPDADEFDKPEIRALDPAAVARAALEPTEEAKP